MKTPNSEFQTPNFRTECFFFESDAWRADRLALENLRLRFWVWCLVLALIGLGGFAAAMWHVGFYQVPRTKNQEPRTNSDLQRARVQNETVEQWRKPVASTREGEGRHSGPRPLHSFSPRPNVSGSVNGSAFLLAGKFREAGRGAAVAVPPGGNSLRLADLFQFTPDGPVLVRIDAAVGGKKADDRKEARRGGQKGAV